VRKLVTASIVSWALAEHVAIYGVIVGFMLHEVWPYGVFGPPALVAMLLLTPRRAVVEDVVRAADAA
jgi:hypothetical protein